MLALATDPEAPTLPATVGSPSPIDGHCVGPYRLCIELASGGMASVYLAQALSGSQRAFVALKVMHPHLSQDPTFVEMFLDEALIASQIRHANVGSVFDFGVTTADQHYIAMEYLAGESLAAVWRKTAELPADERLARCIARVLSEACEGLHAAHELTDAAGEPLHVVHRDISPENIMLTYDGVAKILDFGVASAACQHHLTRTGILKGKFAYIAPEVLLGSKADRRADVWGMGATAWELLTGKRLFRNPTDLDTLRAIVEEPIARPSEVRAGLPSALDEVVLRALARDPAARYQTAREFGYALLRASAGAGDVIGLGDLSEWMQQLFPTGRQRSRDLLDLIGRVAGRSAAGAAERARRPTRVQVVTPRSEPPAQATDDSHEMVRTSYWAHQPPRVSEPPRFRPSLAMLRPGLRYAVPCLALLAGVFVGRLPGSGGALPFLGPASQAGTLAAVPTASSPTAVIVRSAQAPATVLADTAFLQAPYVVRVEQDGSQLVLRIETRDWDVPAPIVAGAPGPLP